MEILLPLIYAAIFIFLIRKINFFGSGGISKNLLSFLFCIKILFGIFLWLIYTRYYTDRSKADIFKFFDDSAVMYEALWKHPRDYFSMLLGIGNNSPYFDQVYYTRMNFWYREFESSIYNDSHTIIRFNAFVRLFSFGCYHVHMVFMCFISFTGSMAIYKTFIPYLPGKKKELIFAVFLIPSVLLWSAGVLKEGFLFFGMGMMLYYFHKSITQGFSLKNFLWICISVFVLLLSKFYVLACLLPGALAWWWAAKSGYKNTVLKFFITVIASFAFALMLHFIFPSYDLLKVLSRRQSDFLALAKGGTYLVHKKQDTIYIRPADQMNIEWIKDSLCRLKPGMRYYIWSRRILIDSGNTAAYDSSTYRLFRQYKPAGSRITLTPLEPNAWSLLKNIPYAFLNTLIRPFIFESRSPIILLQATENTCILLFCLACLFWGRMKKENLCAFCFCIFFVLFLYTLTGLVTPITGAIVRYRVPALPFLMIAFLLLLDKEKMVRKVPFIG